MTVDQRALLSDLQKQVRRLEDDIRERAATTPEVAARLEEHRKALKVGRTATGFSEWRDSQVTQAAVAWVLGTVFVRFCEDNRLIEDAWISGPGGRLREAGERQTQFLIDQPHFNDRDWLLAAFAHLAELPAVASLFDMHHNPLFRLEISADGAESLIAFWRRGDEDTAHRPSSAHQPAERPAAARGSARGAHRAARGRGGALGGLPPARPRGSAGAGPSRRRPRGGAGHVGQRCRRGSERGGRQPLRGRPQPDPGGTSGRCDTCEPCWNGLVLLAGSCF